MEQSRDMTYRELTSALEAFAEAARRRNGGRPLPGERLEAWWYHEHPVFSLTDGQRLKVVLPVLKWEAERGLLTRPSRRELYLSYDDYKTGKLEGLLPEDEEEEVFRDLTECYFSVYGCYPDWGAGPRSQGAAVHSGGGASLPKGGGFLPGAELHSGGALLMRREYAAAGMTRSE